MDDRCIELSYDLDRGLPAESYGIPFGFVCAGIFVELCAIAAHGHSFEVAERLCHDDMRFASRDRLHHLGTLTLIPHDGPVPDLDAALITRGIHHGCRMSRASSHPGSSRSSTPRHAGGVIGGP